MLNRRRAWLMTRERVKPRIKMVNRANVSISKKPKRIAYGCRRWRARKCEREIVAESARAELGPGRGALLLRVSRGTEFPYALRSTRCSRVDIV